MENYCIIASSGKLWRTPFVFALYLSSCPVAVLWFDFALTFTTEVRRIWRREFSGATLVFLLMRYIAVVERVFFVLEVLLWKSTDEV